MVQPILCIVCRYIGYAIIGVISYGVKDLTSRMYIRTSSTEYGWTFILIAEIGSVNSSAVHRKVPFCRDSWVQRPKSCPRTSYDRSDVLTGLCRRRQGPSLQVLPDVEECWDHGLVCELSYSVVCFTV